MSFSSKNSKNKNNGRRQKSILYLLKFENSLDVSSYTERQYQYQKEGIHIHIKKIQKKYTWKHIKNSFSTFHFFKYVIYFMQLFTSCRYYTRTIFSTELNIKKNNSTKIIDNIIIHIFTTIFIAIFISIFMMLLHAL